MINEENKNNSNKLPILQENSNNNLKIKKFSSLEEFLNSNINNNDKQSYAPVDSNNLVYYPIRNSKEEQIITNSKFNFFFELYFDYSYNDYLNI